MMYHFGNWKTNMILKLLVTVLLFSVGIAETFGQNRQKIPIDGNRWYQLTNVEKGLQQLFDGDLFTAVDAQFDKIIPLHESYYPLLKGESMVIDSIRFYDWNGISTKPFTLYIIDSNWNRKAIASFDGSKYDRWVGPYPERPDIIKLDIAARNIMYLMIVAENDFPSEIECYGYYTPPSATTPVLKRQHVIYYHLL